MIPLQERKLAAFGYLWALSFAVYFQHKEQSFVREHARQGMFLTILSVVAACIPIDIVVIAVELVLAMLFIVGFYQAYHGERFQIFPKKSLNINMGAWEFGAGEPVAPPSSAEKEKAFVCYIPLVAIFFLHREEGSRFVQLHCRYALWIQGASAVLGLLLFLPALMALVVGGIASAYGMIRALQGEATIFDQSHRLAELYPALDDVYLAAVAHLQYGARQLSHNASPIPTAQQLYMEKKTYYDASKEALHTRVHDNYITPLYLQYGAYLIGPVVLLLCRTPLLLHHALQGTIILLLTALGITTHSNPLLFLDILLWFCFVLQVNANAITLLPGTAMVEHALLSTLFPPRHD